MSNVFDIFEFVGKKSVVLWKLFLRIEMCYFTSVNVSQKICASAVETRDDGKL